jgi:hypothetical protein
MADAMLAETGKEPVIYTGSFWNDWVLSGHNTGDPPATPAQLFRLKRCTLIVASYPNYGPTASQWVNGYVPSQWATAALTLDANGPPAPFPWPTWDGWQFSAGFNGQGHKYGFQSTDLDLNIVTQETWALWTGGLPDPPPLPPTPPDPPSGDDMATVIGFIQCNAGTQGRHIDGTVYECPVDGTTFFVTPGGQLQWVRTPQQLSTKMAVLSSAGLRADIWNTPVGDPDVFGNLEGDVPGRPAGWVDPHAPLPPVIVPPTPAPPVVVNAPKISSFNHPALVGDGTVTYES